MLHSGAPGSIKHRASLREQATDRRWTWTPDHPTLIQGWHNPSLIGEAIQQGSLASPN